MDEKFLAKIIDQLLRQLHAEAPGAQVVLVIRIPDVNVGVVSNISAEQQQRLLQHALNTIITQPLRKHDLADLLKDDDDLH